MGFSNIQFLTDADGKKVSVVVSIEEFEAMRERLEELEDIAAYDAALADGSDPTPLPDFLKELHLKM